MVWLTAMGLTFGLVMVVYLIGLIIVNGLAAFGHTRGADRTPGGSKAGINDARQLGGRSSRPSKRPSREMGHATRANGR